MWNNSYVYDDGTITTATGVIDTGYTMEPWTVGTPNPNDKEYLDVPVPIPCPDHVLAIEAKQLSREGECGAEVRYTICPVNIQSKPFSSTDSTRDAEHS